MHGGFMQNRETNHLRESKIDEPSSGNHSNRSAERIEVEKYSSSVYISYNEGQIIVI